jgi:tetratricopeptide (TPR) repeat protein
LASPQHTAQFEAFQSNYWYLTNDQQKAVTHGLRGLRIAEKENHRRLRIELGYRIAQPYYQLGRYSDAIELLEAAVELIKPEERGSRLGMSAMPVVICYTWLTLCYAELGDFARAQDKASVALMLVKETEHPLSTAFACWGQGQLCLLQRNYGEAISALERGLEVCQRWSLRFWTSRLASALGLAHVMRGDPEAAVVLIKQALEEAQAMHFSVDISRLFERLAAAHLAGGRHVMADSKARQALELALRSDAKGQEAWILRLLGEVHTAGEALDTDTAENSFHRSLELASSLDMRPLIVLCYEGLSRLYCKRGLQREGDEALEKARTISDTFRSGNVSYAAS